MSCQNASLVEGYNWKSPPEEDTANLVTLTTKQTITARKTFTISPQLTTSPTFNNEYGQYQDYLVTNENVTATLTPADVTTPSGTSVQVNSFTVPPDYPSNVVTISVSGRLTALALGDDMESFNIQVWGTNSGFLFENGTVLLDPPLQFVDFSFTFTTTLLEADSDQLIYMEILPITEQLVAGPWNVRIELVVIDFTLKFI